MKIKRDYETEVYNLLDSQGYLEVSTAFMRKYGSELANLIAYYVDLCQHYNNGPFPIKNKYVSSQLGLTEYIIAKGKKKLKEIGVITTESKGFPSSEWITIDFKKLKTLI